MFSVGIEIARSLSNSINVANNLVILIFCREHIANILRPNAAVLNSSQQ